MTFLEAPHSAALGKIGRKRPDLPDEHCHSFREGVSATQNGNCCPLVIAYRGKRWEERKNARAKSFDHNSGGFRRVVGHRGTAASREFDIMDDSVPHCWAPSTGGWWCASGCGRTPGNVAAGLVDPANTTRAGQTLAHEVGHNLDRPHTCSAPCRVEGGCVAQYTEAHLGVYGVNLEDPNNPVYLDPDTHHDIMSYCPPKWISDITYGALRDHFVLPASQRTDGALQTVASGSSSLSSSRTLQGPGLGLTKEPVVAVTKESKEYLVGGGHIVDGLVTMTRPFYRLMYPTGTSDDPGEGRYSLELQDANGMPLFIRYFDVVGDTYGIDEGLGYFREKIPWQAGTAHIVIKEGQTVLRITHVSANPPEVTLLSPNGGEFWPPYGEQTVTWTGRDADSNPLRYLLQYSPDDGNTWKAVATNLVGETYTLDVGRLGGSETARLRVVASDGVNTGQDDSDNAFTVEGKPPKVYVVYPLDGSIVPPGRLVVLEGAATDLEDGALTDGTLFAWSSSLEGELGMGRELRFDDLRPGWHTITLEVPDSGHFVGQASVSLFIGSRVYLPVSFRSYP